MALREPSGGPAAGGYRRRGSIGTHGVSAFAGGFGVRADGGGLKRRMGVAAPGGRLYDRWISRLADFWQTGRTGRAAVRGHAPAASGKQTMDTEAFLVERQRLVNELQSHRDLALEAGAARRNSFLGLLPWSDLSKLV